MILDATRAPGILPIDGISFSLRPPCCGSHGAVGDVGNVGGGMPFSWPIGSSRGRARDMPL